MLESWSNVVEKRSKYFPSFDYPQLFGAVPKWYSDIWLYAEEASTKSNEIQQVVTQILLEIDVRREQPCISTMIANSENVTGESERTLESMTTGLKETEPNSIPECGRLVFRGVELAYLIINGKQMLPLAEMLALVFSTTPRTTLFTRMEKINAGRHFCQPSEIKLLKTVNGIHGSSANCTLIPKEDVERYCAIYLDREIEIPCRLTKERKTPRKNECRVMKALKAKDNAEFGKLAEVAKYESKSIGIAKLKVDKASNDEQREINTTLTTGPTPTEAIDGLSAQSSADKDVERVFSHYSSSPSSHYQEHSTNSTQTISMLSWPTKKRVNKAMGVNKNEKLEGKEKRPRTVDEESCKFNSPLKRRKKCEGQEEILGKSNSSGKSPNSKKRTNFPPNLTLDSRFSDSLSNDSGFASLTAEDCTSPTKVGFQAELNGCAPCRTKRKKEKMKSPTSELSEKLNLSPPPLVIKKHQNTWQVETKLEGVKKKLYKAKGKKLKKIPEGKVVNGLLATNLSANVQLLKKKRKRRKLLKVVEESSIHSSTFANKDSQIAGADEGAVKKKRKRRRRKNVQTNPNETVTNGFTPNSDLQCFATPVKKKNFGKKDLGKPKTGGKVNHIACLQSKPPMPANAVTPQSTPLKHASPSGVKLTPVRAPILKATPNFSLSNLFPSTSGLILHEGDLCPEYTMACHDPGVKPPPSHPLWKWRLGAPVFSKTHKVNFKIRKIKQLSSKTNSSESVTKQERVANLPPSTSFESACISDAR